MSGGAPASDARPSLLDLAERGYVIDDWAIWQQGMCGTYACALIDAYPTLRLGVLAEDFDDGWVPAHFVAHDDDFAYDSAGSHPLPYTGVHGDLRWMPDVGPPADWGLPHDEGATPADLRAAIDHARRHRISPDSQPVDTGA